MEYGFLELHSRDKASMTYLYPKGVKESDPIEMLVIHSFETGWCQWCKKNIWPVTPEGE
ncbi:MAG TPA: hypothetical protein VJL87_02320 [Bdellovibrionota bacterium]|nr:hypothetical protein [Bdellovibrionota bacterium]